MSASATVASVSVPPEGPLDTPDDVTTKARLGVIAWLSIGWLVLVVVLALAAPLLPIDKYDRMDAINAGLGPFHMGSHILGTDSNGHDMVSQLIYGGRASMIVGIGSIAFGMTIGGIFGLVAGYFRGWVDRIFTGMFDILLAFPQLVLSLFLVAVLRGDPQVKEGLHLPTELILILGLGIVAIPILARITRASTLTWSQRDFVLAAKAQGAGHFRIMVKEILPNVLPALFSLALLSVGVAIVAEGTLSLIGVGIQLPEPSWGNIIAVNQTDLNSTPYVIFFPAIAIFLTVFSLNHLGDVIRKRFDVRESGI